ncbi:MAG: tetratricopeptide repeat protein [Gammaproteobacteria bacterium]|nr:tetratricopeptide repeat protein [Gammaproteobacteria bacterium]
MTRQLDSLLDSGIAAQQSGRQEEALTFFRKAYELATDDAEVMSLFGLALSQSGAYEEAAPLLQSAVRLESQQIGFRMNLLTHLMTTGDYDAAKIEAVNIIKINPAFPPALERLAEAQIALNELEQAESVIGKLSEMDERSPSLFRLTCLLFTQKADWLKLEQKARSWIEMLPHDPLAWQMLCTAYIEQGRIRLAEENFRKVLELRQGNAEDLARYAQICLQCFEYNRAREALQKAQSIDPDMAEVQVSLALLHTYHGDFQHAAGCCRHALQLEEDNVDAYRQLVNVTRGKLTDDEFDCLLKLSCSDWSNKEQAIDIEFALAQVYEARKDYSSAFTAFEKANHLNKYQAEKHQQLYDRQAAFEKTRKIKSIFTKEVTRSVMENAMPCPIFVLGMPRSGTTLVETCLSAHSLIEAGGERPLLPQILDSVLKTSTDTLPDSGLLKQWVNAYLTDRPEMSSATHFTDKNPLNFEAIGLLSILFPNAPVLHIRRNPIDTCFSIFKHKFSRFWSFTHSLNDIAHYYSQYAQLMNYWEQSLGARFMSIQYETLASDFSTMAPQLIAHCNLDWEDSCLDFQSKGNPVSTLSAVQIRDTVAVKNSALLHYQDFLSPLKNALHAEGVDLETGALSQ